MTSDELDEARVAMARWGFEPDTLSDEDVRRMITMFGEAFRNTAPLTAADAATVILDGVRAGTWRILIGDDARRLDEAVRADPIGAYGPDGLNLSSVTG
jgi:hypothetical protein